MRFSPSVDGTGQGGGQLAKELAARKEKEKWATCKQCGARVERTMEGIERHDEICRGVNEGRGGGGGQGGGGRGEGLFGRGTGGGSDFDSGGSSSSSSSSSGSSSGGGLWRGAGRWSWGYGQLPVHAQRAQARGVPRLYPSATALAQAEVDKPKMAQARIVFRTRNGNELSGRGRSARCRTASPTRRRAPAPYDFRAPPARLERVRRARHCRGAFHGHAARPVKEPAMEKREREGERRRRVRVGGHSHGRSGRQVAEPLADQGQRRDRQPGGWTSSRSS